jgi:hypothetical protein
MNKISIWMTVFTMSTSCFAFDVEDYAGTYRATLQDYKNASTAFELNYSQLTVKERLLKSSCYKIVGADFAHLEGLRNGTCAKDGEKPDKYGGAFGSGTKLGTRIKDLLLSTPAWANFPDVTSKVSAANTFNATIIAADQGSAAVTITLDPTCTPTNDYLASASPTQITDIIAEYKTNYDSYVSSAHAVREATAHLKSAIEAYKATSTVYTMSIGCDAQLGLRDPDLYDPYVP